MTSALSANQLPLRYRLIAALGEGSMGAVSRVYDRLTGREVALKQVVLPDDLAPGEVEQELLTLAHEFRVLAGLRHPHIISVLDYGFDAERRPFYTMELLAGGRDILDVGRELPRAGQLTLLLQALEALAYLHRRGVLHHDLKPANVLVADGRLRLLDFGLAVIATQQRDDDAFGTLQYLAPEVLDGQPYTEAADLYSLGVIAYELLVGRHPTPAETVHAFLERLASTPPDLASLADEPALSDFIGQLLAKDPAARPPSAQASLDRLRQVAGIPATADDQAIRESYLQAATFIGRERELTTLTDALVATSQGRGSAWLVGGESGIGKSRLLDELRTQALVMGFQVLRGQAVEGAGLPYQIWRDSLRTLLATAPAVDDLTAGVLLPLVPDLLQLLGRTVPPPPELRGDGAQLRLLSAIAQPLAHASGPVLLLLEDLHWADESLMPLPMLLSQIGDRSVMVVGSYRSDERPDLPQRLPDMRPIALSRLSPLELSQLSEAMLGAAGAQPEVHALLQRETEGNAFFLVEVVRALAQAAGALGDISGSSLPQRLLLDGVRGVVQRRIARVPEALQGLLRLTAIAGREIELELLEQLAGDMAGERFLAACADAAVLELHDARWQFRHSKIREAVLAPLAAEELPALHRSVAQALATVHPGDASQAARLAEHWRAAGDAARELETAIVAARHAASQHAHRTALHFFDRARELMPADELARRFDLLADRLMTVDVLGEREDQARAIEELSALAEALDDDERRVTVRYRQAELETRLGRYDACVACCRAALALAEALGSEAWRVRLLVLWAFALLELRLLDEALARISEAEAIAAAAGLPEHETRVLGRKASILGFMGELDQARAIDRAVIAACREADQPSALSAALGNASNHAMFAGDYAACFVYGEEALSLVRAIGDMRGETILLNNMGRTRAILGDYAGAIDALEGSYRRSLQTDDRWTASNSVMNLGEAYLKQGDHERAERHLRQALDMRRALANSVGAAQALNLLGALYLTAERLDQAEASYDKAESLLGAGTQEETLIDAWAGQGAVALRRGDMAAVRERAGQILALLSASGAAGEWSWSIRTGQLYAMLRALGDVRADEILEASYDALQSELATLADAAMRDRYCADIPEHRELLALYRDAHGGS